MEYRLHEITPQTTMYFHPFFLLTGSKNRLTRKEFPSGNGQNTENTSHVGSSSEEFVAADDAKACTAPIMADNGILKFVQSSKNIIDADSDNKNEMNNAAPDPSLSEMWIMKNMRSYIDAHSNGEMNKKMHGSVLPRKVPSYSCPPFQYFKTNLLISIQR
ncbi:hypothetical protein TNCV_2972111 [Trichonephila clavipes]|nr:hypothetical protein TNCV_2972111 [Trichonephila clavipes]